MSGHIDPRDLPERERELEENTESRDELSSNEQRMNLNEVIDPYIMAVTAYDT